MSYAKRSIEIKKMKMAGYGIFLFLFTCDDGNARRDAREGGSISSRLGLFDPALETLLGLHLEVWLLAALPHVESQFSDA